jgi:DNA-binding transcriptional ArsR family regulator
VRPLHHPKRDEIELVSVLSALGHPLRLQAVTVLADADECICGAIIPEVPKSTMTTHWRVLRESGVTWERPEGRKIALRLRREDLDARFPGLLDSVLKDSSV